MRLTNKMMIDNAVQHMASNLERINTYSERVATNKKFQTPSEDPISSSIAMSLRSTLKTSETYRTTADLVNDWMGASDFAMDQMERLGIQAQGLIQRGLNDTMGTTERATMAAELDELIKQAVDVGNYSHNGQYIFAGYKTTTKPFEMVDANTISYVGDQNVMTRSLGPGQTITANVNGDTTFSPFFQQLISARNSLTLNDTASLRSTLSGLQSSIDSIGEKRTSNGARLRQVHTAVEYLDKVDIEVKALLSKKEDANMAEAIAALRGQENAYQSVLEVSQRAISALNLFDYLR